MPEADLVDLRNRVKATRWPDKETVNDRSQGARQAKLQALVKYWGTDYDWRKVEAKLNALPQFTTEIDRLDIHFIHAVTVFPGEIYQAPKTWTEQAYPKLICFNAVDKCGHFAAWEEPQLFSAELRKAFRSLR